MDDSTRIEALYDELARLYHAGAKDSAESKAAMDELRAIQGKQAAAIEEEWHRSHPMPVMEKRDEELLALARAIMAEKPPRAYLTSWALIGMADDLLEVSSHPAIYLPRDVPKEALLAVLEARQALLVADRALRAQAAVMRLIETIGSPADDDQESIT